MDIEEINSDRDKFLSHITHSVEAELKKMGLKLINVNITDIHDESGYIQALGKEAAAKAINTAKISVAQKSRDGAIGEALAVQDERTQVADAMANAKIGETDAQQKERVKVADLNATAQIGEAEAIQNIKIDKITVWENGNSPDGKNSTANFISGMYKAVPPLQEMFNMAGMQLPNFLKGENVEEVKSDEIKEEKKSDKK